MQQSEIQQSDDDPHPPSPDTNEFFLPGSGLSVLLIHGLSGTPYEMRYLGERLAADGLRVLGVRLKGHAGAPEELGASNHSHWYESAVEGFERLHQYGDATVVIGLSMGAILAARLAADQGEAVAGLVMLAPAFFLPTPTRVALRLMRPAHAWGDKVYFRSGVGSDIHDDAARSVHPGTRLMPLGAALSLAELSDRMRPRLGEVVQPALVIHSRQDHTCPFERNVDFVMNHLGSADKRAVTLEESYHVIVVDSEKDRVAEETLEFLAQFRPPLHVRASG
jgi:carboxylesterase